MSYMSNAANIKLATKFIKKFKFTVITLDQFDMFIIDNNMAKDPGDKDENPQAHRGFGMDRGACKERLNAGGVYLNGNAFKIGSHEHGKTYEIQTYNKATRDDIDKVAEVVHQLSRSKLKGLKKINRQIGEVIERARIADKNEDMEEWQSTQSRITLGEAHVKEFTERIERMTETLKGHLQTIHMDADKQLERHQQKQLTKK